MASITSSAFSNTQAYRLEYDYTSLFKEKGCVIIMSVKIENKPMFRRSCCNFSLSQSRKHKKRDVRYGLSSAEDRVST